MKALARFGALPANERWLLARAALVVAAIRIALWTLPFRWLCAWVGARRTGARPWSDLPASKFAWAVRVAARRIPAASCLTQALALQWLLATAGQDSRVHLGVSKAGERGFEAHAWLVSQGEIVIGNEQALDRLAPILALPREDY